jgi:protein involved in polysaccharide export with SLBB domain
LDWGFKKSLGLRRLLFECTMKHLLFAAVIIVGLGMPLSATQIQTTDVLSAASQRQEQSANHSPAPESKLGTSGADDSGSKAANRVSAPSLSLNTAENVSALPDKPVSTAPAATSIYRVGVGDVLDIQLLNSPIRESTLYSILAGGLLDYPLAGDPFRVQGLTADEISSILISKIKLYVDPKVSVSVREYASHNVIITGLVRDPGTKALRREAVPLFVILAEAQPHPDAARAIVMRSGSTMQSIDINDTAATSVLIYSNDVIRLVSAPPPVPLYFYIAGQIGMPGQRDFHAGMTLTQSIFASGGVTRYAGSKVKVMRQAADGLLVTTEHNLKRIAQGKDPDPQIEAGDRIEVSRSGW